MSNEPYWLNVDPPGPWTNKFIPILMHFCSFVSNWSAANRIKAACYPAKCDVIKDVKLFSTVNCRVLYRRINCRIFYVIQSDVALQVQVR